MAKAYLAGPMTGFPFFNFRAFDLLTAKGRRLGWEVFNPAEMDRARGFDEMLYPTGDASKLPPGFLDDCIKMDTDILVNKLHKANGDAIALMPGWEMSTGARAERGLAKWAGLKLLDAVTWLPINDAPRIIGLAGYAKTGKDTIYGVINDEFARVAFADPLKAKVHTAFPDLFAAMQPFAGVASDGSLSAKRLTKEDMRPMYVDVGAIHRAAYPDYWINEARLSVARIKAAMPKSSICITDVRYANEVDWLKGELGGTVFRVRRIDPATGQEIGPANEEERRSFAEIDAKYPDLPVVWNNWSPRAAGLQLLAKFHGLDSAKFRGNDTSDQPIDTLALAA